MSPNQTMAFHLREAAKAIEVNDVETFKVYMDLFEEIQHEYPCFLTDDELIEVCNRIEKRDYSMLYYGDDDAAIEKDETFIAEAKKRGFVRVQHKTWAQHQF